MTANKKFQSILKQIKKMRDDRDWMQFHNPKDLAEAISIEAAELLEHFLWKTPKESENYAKNKKNLREISDELADIFNYAFELADNLGIDIEKTILKKLKNIEKKYPVSKSRGKAIKYNKL
ncbi:nucleotide pyrophosphohydrolase [Candidatus Roizmanbacteria bacterium]|nr:nucleotide pyrophosphohydrolase [Candidatus Roizmanbacteria bacterium]